MTQLRDRNYLEWNGLFQPVDEVPLEAWLTEADDFRLSILSFRIGHRIYDRAAINTFLSAVKKAG